MPIEQLDSTPLVERVRQAVMTAILEKDFAGRLPSETVLAEMFNVSRTTIRAALQSLEQDGVITRRRSIGTTINAHVGPSSLALQRMVGFDWMLKEKGYQVKVDLRWRRGTCPEDLSRHFGTLAGQDCLLSEKKFFADGMLAIYVRDMVPVASVKESVLSRFDTLPAAQTPSLFEFSHLHFKKPVDHAIAKIVAMAARRPEDTALEIGRSQAFIRLYETHYTSRAKEVAYSVVDLDGRFGNFEVFRRP